MISLFLLSAVSGKENVKELEQRLKEIDHRLEHLSTLSLQSGVGAIGERSAVHQSADVREWFQVTFKELSDFDQIMIVPALWRDERSQFLSDAFPAEFHIEVGYSDSDDGVVVASFNESDTVIPRTAPVVVEVEVKQAKWVRVVATKLSPRAWDGAYIFQLSEMLVFNGSKNIALHQKVTGFSEEGEADHGARRREFLVDGNLPYLMHSAHGEKSNAYRFRIYDKRTIYLSVDLGRGFAVSSLLFHTLEVSDSIPQANRPDFGLPKEFKLYGANQPDFSDEQLIDEFKYESAYDFAPVIQLTFQEKKCRYFRIALTSLDYASEFEVTTPFYFFACAEIELIADGKNVLLGKVFHSNYSPDGQKFEYEAFDKSHLTDGANMFGRIMTQRAWLEELSERHDLETERPMIQQKLKLLYAQQKKNIRLLQWVLVGLLILLGGGYLMSRISQMKKITEIRKRFAADLHDELGANLHAIGILSDVAEDCVNSSDEEHLRKTIKEIRATTERTAESVRHTIHTEEGKSHDRKFKDDMERIARRMFTRITYEVVVDGEEVLRELPIRMRHDLFLFYKECLANISRHSMAKSFKAELAVRNDEVVLSVSDNGVGDQASVTPESLLRRAKLLRATLNYVSSTQEPSGVSVSLRCKIPKRILKHAASNTP